MKIAIIENDKVTNIVTGRLEKVAELFDSVAAINEATGQAWIGARFNGNKFEPKKIHKSWTWNEKSFSYEPPVAKPQGDFYWSESDLNWLPIVEDEASE